MLKSLIRKKSILFIFTVLCLLTILFISGAGDEKVVEAERETTPIVVSNPMKELPKNMSSFIPSDKGTQQDEPFTMLNEITKVHKESIEIINETFMITKLLGELSHVGILKPNQHFELIGEDDEYFYIRFGFSNGMVFKEDAKSIGNATFNEKDIIEKDHSETIITKNPVRVFDFTGKPNNEIAILRENLRYPILQEEEEWYLIEIGGRQGYVSKDVVELDKGVPAIMYHHFLTDEENEKYIGLSTTISPRTFEEQMTFIQKEGFEAISTEELKQYLNKEANLPGKTLVITIDDGLKSSARYAAPILRKLDLKANAYLISSRIGEADIEWDPNKNQAMTLNEIKENKDIYYYHGHTDSLHYSSNGQGAVNVVPYEQALKDLQTNYDFLDSNGYTSTHFAYPYGHFSEQARNALVEVGFSTAFTTKRGFNQPGDDLYLLKRWNIGPTVDMTQFEEIVLN